MSVNTEARRQQLENLQEFIASSANKIRIILEKLEWEPDKVLEESSLITCSLDTAHKISRKHAAEHVEKCTLRKGGYDLKELFLSEPVNNQKSSVLIDDYKKIEILSEYRKANKDYKPGWNGQDPDPKTADRLSSTYSVQERLALYDYTATATTGPPDLPDYDVVHPKRDGSKPLTYEEQLAQERDAKRRRIKYKAIHTSHKSHTEVLRELIEGQMDLYKDWLDHSGAKKDDVKEERERSVASRNSTRSDGSRREKRRCKSRSGHSSDRDRDHYHEKRRPSSRRDDDHNKKRKDVERRSEYKERSPRRQSRYSDSRKRRSRERRRSRDRRNSDKSYRS